MLYINGKNIIAGDNVQIIPSGNIVADNAASAIIELDTEKENTSNKETSTLDTSTTKFPVNNVVKSYVDQILGNANALVYKGVIDCSTNPNYPASDAGHLYITSIAGKIGGASGISVEAGDMCICNTDTTVSGDEATVGTSWNVIQKNIIGAVSGPASSVDENIAIFNAVSGKIIKDSGVKLSDKLDTNNPSPSGTVTLPKTINVKDTTGDHEYQLAVSELTANRIITLPLLTGNDEYVFKDHIQTLTNKTLTKPVINGTNPTGATYTPATGAQTVTIDCATNNMHIVTGHASGTAITFAISNVTNNQAFIISVSQGSGTVSTITAWFATVRWAGGTIPTLTATLNKRDIFGFIRTGNNTYDGFIVAQNI